MSAGLSWTGWVPYYGRRCPVPVDWCDRPCSCQRCRTPPARPLSAPLCAGDQPVKGKSHQSRHVYTCSLVFKGRPWSDREYRQTKMKIKEKKWTIQEIKLCKRGARVRTRWPSISPPPPPPPPPPCDSFYIWMGHFAILHAYTCIEEDSNVIKMQ